MEELIINCETGERTRRKFTPVEIDIRLAEIAKAEQDEARRERVALKDELVAMQSKAREVEGLITEGIFEQTDLDVAETRIEDLKTQLNVIESESL